MTVNEIMELVDEYARDIEDIAYSEAVFAHVGKSRYTDRDKSFAELRTAIEELAADATVKDCSIVADAKRLEWAMNNMSQHNYILFGMHVMNVGGTGDIADCRTFIDKRMQNE